MRCCMWLCDICHCWQLSCSSDPAHKWNCLGASLGRSLASLKKPMPAKKMRMLWQKAILETMMLIQMNRETQPCRLRHCLLMSLCSLFFPPLSMYFLIFSPFYFSLSFIGFTYVLLLSIPFFSTRIVPLRFQARGRRKRPNLGLVCCVYNLCYPYSLVRWILVFCSIWFSLVLCVPSVLWHCWLGHLTHKTRPRYDL